MDKARPNADMTPDEERWAEALAVERLHGLSAPRFIAERIGALALSGDIAGIARWRQIAERLNKLSAMPGHPVS